MTDCLDDIIDLRDDDSDTLETLEQSDDDLDQLEDLHVDRSQEQLVQRLTKTEVEVETIRGRLARVLERAEWEERFKEAEQADCFQHRRVNLPAGLDLLKHHLIEELEKICQNEKALIFLLCGQTKSYIKNL